MAAAYKKRISTVRNANQGIDVIDDFLFIESNGGAGIFGLFTSSIAGGSGAVTAVRPVGSIYYPGAVQLYIQATNDYAGIITPPNYSLSGNAALDIQTRFFRDGDFSNSHENAFGFSDSMVTRASETTGAMIYYNKAVSDNFVCYVRNAGGLTQEITTTPVPDVNTDTYLRVLATPNQVQFFVNGALVSTIAQSPSSSTPMSIGWTRHKTSGSSSGSIYIDAISILQNFTTPRSFLSLK